LLDYPDILSRLQSNQNAILSRPYCCARPRYVLSGTSALGKRLTTIPAAAVSTTFAAPVPSTSSDSLISREPIVADAAAAIEVSLSTYNVGTWFLPLCRPVNQFA